VIADDLQPRTITPLAKWLIGRVTDRQSIPRYASPAWEDLPDGDPRRAAAVLIAAEAWANHCSPWQVAQDLADELAAQQYIASRELVEAGHDVYNAAPWPAIFARPTFAELCDRRGEPERAERARERWAS
jgi:hypothetical protein